RIAGDLGQQGPGPVILRLPHHRVQQQRPRQLPFAVSLGVERQRDRAIRLTHGRPQVYPSKRCTVYADRAAMARRASSPAYKRATGLSVTRSHRAPARADRRVALAELDATPDDPDSTVPADSGTTAYMKTFDRHLITVMVDKGFEPPVIATVMVDPPR